MAARGQGLFSLYIYIENFKNLLVRNRRTDFHITLQKCSFGNPLPRLFRPFGLVKKHGRQGAGLIFPIYIYIENFKNLLVRNHWTDFNIILQKCSFGDPPVVQSVIRLTSLLRVISLTVLADSIHNILIFFTKEM